MLTENERNFIKHLEEEYERCEQKALNCKTEKTEAKYINKMRVIYDQIARICAGAREREERMREETND